MAGKGGQSIPRGHKQNYHGWEWPLASGLLPDQVVHSPQQAWAGLEKDKQIPDESTQEAEA